MGKLLADPEAIGANGRKQRPRLRGLRIRSAVWQKVFLDVVAVGLEQHLGAAMFADLLGGPLDHAVALAGLLEFQLAGRGYFEALFSARFGLQLVHFALLIGATRGARPHLAGMCSRR